MPERSAMNIADDEEQPADAKAVLLLWLNWFYAGGHNPLAEPLLIEATSKALEGYRAG